MNSPIFNEWSGHFEQNLDVIMQPYFVTSENKINEEELQLKTTKLIEKLASMKNVQFYHALVGICALFQAGAYLKTVTNRKVFVIDTEFSKREVEFAAEQINLKYTFRSVARCLKFHTATIALRLGLQGHLYSQYKIEHPEHIADRSSQAMTIAIYCTDFQIDNPYAPITVREFLSNRAKRRSNNKKT